MYLWRSCIRQSQLIYPDFVQGLLNFQHQWTNCRSTSLWHHFPYEIHKICSMVVKTVKHKNETLNIKEARFLFIFLVDPGLHVKADSMYTILGHFVLVIKWHLGLKGGKCGCCIHVNKWRSWVQSALHAIWLYVQSGSDDIF